jgi:hypothetical protein
MPHPYVTRVIAGQLSRFTRYYDAVVQIAPLPNDDGSLLQYVDCATKAPANRIDDVPAAARRAVRCCSTAATHSFNEPDHNHSYNFGQS